MQIFLTELLGNPKALLLIIGSLLLVYGAAGKGIRVALRGGEKPVLIPPPITSLKIRVLITALAAFIISATSISILLDAKPENLFASRFEGNWTGAVEYKSEKPTGTTESLICSIKKSSSGLSVATLRCEQTRKDSTKFEWNFDVNPSIGINFADEGIRGTLQLHGETHLRGEGRRMNGAQLTEIRLKRVSE